MPNPKKFRTLLQFTSLQLNLALLISSILPGNKKLKNSLHSSITSIFVVLNNFIKNRVELVYVFLECQGGGCVDEDEADADAGHDEGSRDTSRRRRDPQRRQEVSWERSFDQLHQGQRNGKKWRSDLVSVVDCSVAQTVVKK